jgi:hypothetical protein
MMTATRTLNVPKILLDFWQPEAHAERKITEAAVLALVGEGTITISRGAELLGLPPQDFLALMHHHGLSVWDDSAEEVREGVHQLHKALSAA